MSSGTEHQRKALGKGLSALLPASRNPQPAPAPAKATAEAAPGALRLDIHLIDPNPLQPRTVFQEERLAELAQSIRENGIIQPLVVRKAGERYQLIAGERRLRAARLAHLEIVPVVVEQIADERLMEVTLIENIQREDLNPIEVAHAFERLTREFHLSHEQVAQRTGKERSTVTNMLRLLRLPAEVQMLLAEQRLTMGHARALLGLPSAEQQVHQAQRAATEGLSVRQVERIVQKLVEGGEEKAKNEPPALDANVRAAVDELERVLGTRVRIVAKNEERGRLEIEYYSSEDLSRIYETIVGK
jgi:ParB family transcriptional regulator, chromosome partitioning protein